jgi:hypothetical protein
MNVPDAITWVEKTITLLLLKITLYLHSSILPSAHTNVNMTAFWDIALCSLVETDRRFGDASIIARMTEAVRTSETSINFYETTRRNIPEGYHLHTRRRENLKSHT